MAPSPSQTTALSVSIAEAYPTMVEMVDHAEAIALITVAAVKGIDSTAVPVSTDYAISVDRWLATSDPGDEKSRDIVIRQMGGITTDGTALVVEGDPLLVPGERDIVFLREFATGRYVIQGGPSGRLPVHGNSVRAIDPASLSIPSGSLPTVEAAIRTELRSGRARANEVREVTG